jgi:hypothetical protein
MQSPVPAAGGALSRLVAALFTPDDGARLRRALNTPTLQFTPADSIQLRQLLRMDQPDVWFDGRQSSHQLALRHDFVVAVRQLLRRLQGKSMRPLPPAPKMPRGQGLGVPGAAAASRAEAERHAQFPELDELDALAQGLVRLIAVKAPFQTQRPGVRVRVPIPRGEWSNAFVPGEPVSFTLADAYNTPLMYAQANRQAGATHTGQGGAVALFVHRRNADGSDALSAGGLLSAEDVVDLARNARRRKTKPKVKAVVAPPVVPPTIPSAPPIPPVSAWFKPWQASKPPPAPLSPAAAAVTAALKVSPTAADAARVAGAKALEEARKAEEEEKRRLAEEAHAKAEERRRVEEDTRRRAKEKAARQKEALEAARLLRQESIEALARAAETHKLSVEQAKRDADFIRDLEAESSMHDPEEATLLDQMRAAAATDPQNPPVPSPKIPAKPQHNRSQSLISRITDAVKSAVTGSKEADSSEAPDSPVPSDVPTEPVALSEADADLPEVPDGDVMVDANVDNMSQATFNLPQEPQDGQNADVASESDSASGFSKSAVTHEEESESEYPDVDQPASPRRGIILPSENALEEVHTHDEMAARREATEANRRSLLDAAIALDLTGLENKIRQAALVAALKNKTGLTQEAVQSLATEVLALRKKAEDEKAADLRRRHAELQAAAAELTRKRDADMKEEAAARRPQTPTMDDQAGPTAAAQRIAAEEDDEALDAKAAHLQKLYDDIISDVPDKYLPKAEHNAVLQAMSRFAGDPTDEEQGVKAARAIRALKTTALRNEEEARLAEEQQSELKTRVVESSQSILNDKDANVTELVKESVEQFATQIARDVEQGTALDVPTVDEVLDMHNRRVQQAKQLTALQALAQRKAPDGIIAPNHQQAIDNIARLISTVPKKNVASHLETTRKAITLFGVQLQGTNMFQDSSFQAPVVRDDRSYEVVKAADILRAWQEALPPTNPLAYSLDLSLAFHRSGMADYLQRHVLGAQ